MFDCSDINCMDINFSFICCKMSFSNIVNKEKLCKMAINTDQHGLTAYSHYTCSFNLTKLLPDSGFDQACNEGTRRISREPLKLNRVRVNWSRHQLTRPASRRGSSIKQFTVKSSGISSNEPACSLRMIPAHLRGGGH